MQLMSALAGIHGMQQTDKTSIFYNTQTVSIDILYMPTEWQRLTATFQVNLLLLFIFNPATAASLRYIVN